MHNVHMEGKSQTSDGRHRLVLSEAHRARASPRDVMRTQEGCVNVLI